VLDTVSKIGNQASILAIGRTRGSAERLRELLVSDFSHIAISGYPSPSDCGFEIRSHRAVIIEIDTPSALNNSLALIRRIRSENIWSTILAIINSPCSLTRTKCFFAGADHCITLPTVQDEKIKFLSELFKSPEWLPEIKLVLDQTCLCLYEYKRKLDISYQEMKVLDALVSAQGNMLSHDNIAKAMGWNIKFYDPRVLEKSISRLRSKIKKAFDINIVISVRGFGYRLLRGVISVK